MIRLSPPGIAAALTTVAALGGCAVGPDYVRPDQGLPEKYVTQELPGETVAAKVAGGGAQRFVAGGKVPAQWWKQFGAPDLDELVESAIKGNPGLKAAELAVTVAEETALSQQGILLPSVQAGLSSSRQQISEPMASPLASNATLFNLHTAQLSVSYAFDIWGGNRRLVESVDAQAQAQRAARDAAYLGLVANVVAGAVQEASLRAQLEATREIIRILAEQLHFMRRQFELGAIPRINVLAQEAALAQAQAQVPPLEKQLAQQVNALAALAGRFPSGEPVPGINLASLKLPDEVPVSLPSELVERRPDVQVAEAQLRAASALVGVAVSNMLPQFTLTAGAGYQGPDINSLFNPGNLLWNAAAGLVQPIFQGGMLLHRKRAAEAAYEQAAAQYRSVVLGAFQNVADALRAIEIDARALQAAARAEEAAAENLRLTRRQIELGDAGYLALLAAQQSYQQAVITRVQAQAARFSDTAALYFALGGGFVQPESEPAGK